MIGMAATLFAGLALGVRLNAVASWEPPFIQPRDVTVLADGTVAIADAGRNHLVFLHCDGTVSKRGTGGGDPYLILDGKDDTLFFKAPSGVTATADGDVLVADTFHHCVRRLGAGTYSTITPVPDPYESEQANGGEPPVRHPMSVAVDPDGRVYVAEPGNDRVRRIEPDGKMVTVAGTGIRGFGGDGGPAIDALLASPSDLAFAANGELLVADRLNHRIRAVAVDGAIRTIAGTGIPGHSGDGGSAVDAQLCFPAGVASAPDGTIYVADDRNHRICAIDAHDIITTRCEGLSGPTRVRPTEGGGLYLVDTDAKRVRHLRPDDELETLLDDIYRAEPSPRARSVARLADVAAPLIVLAVSAPLAALVI